MVESGSVETSWESMSCQGAEDAPSSNGTCSVPSSCSIRGMKSIVASGSSWSWPCRCTGLSVPVRSGLVKGGNQGPKLATCSRPAHNMRPPTLGQGYCGTECRGRVQITRLFEIDKVHEAQHQSKISGFGGAGGTAGGESSSSQLDSPTGPPLSCHLLLFEDLHLQTAWSRIIHVAFGPLQRSNAGLRAGPQSRHIHMKMCSRLHENTEEVFCLQAGGRTNMKMFFCLFGEDIGKGT